MPLDPEVEKVVGGKRLLLWRKLLEETEYDDPDVFSLMTDGVALVGACHKPACFEPKVVMAKCSEAELRSSATWRRKALLAREKADDELEHRKHLEETSSDEVARGFVMGPFFSESEVSSFLSHDSWSLVRRFVLVQRKKNSGPSTIAWRPSSTPPTPLPSGWSCRTPTISLAWH